MPGGWESLGDMGSIDADGYVYLSRPPDRHDPRRRFERVPGRGRGRARRASARAFVRGDRPARRRPRQPHRTRSCRPTTARRSTRPSCARTSASGSCATRSRARSSSSPNRCATTRASSAAARCAPNEWAPNTCRPGTTGRRSTGSTISTGSIACTGSRSASGSGLASLGPGREDGRSVHCSRRVVAANSTTNAKATLMITPAPARR